MLDILSLPLVVAVKPEGQQLPTSTPTAAPVDWQAASTSLLGATHVPMLLQQVAGGQAPHLTSAGSSAALRQCSVTDEMLNALEGDYLALCEAAAACGMPTGSGALPATRGHRTAGDASSPNSKRKNRGQRLEAIIKAEGEHGSSSEEEDGAEAHDGDEESPRWNDSRDSSSQSPRKRARTTNGANDQGDQGGGGAHSGGSHDGDGGEAGGPDVPEGDRARIRREKNRVAARKCRAKKLAFMNDLQTTLRDLMRKNEEYKMQVITWHKMFSREVRMREAMKRIIAATWQSGLLPGSKNISAHDLIIGLESGSLDVNELLQSLGVPAMSSGSGPLPAIPSGLNAGGINTTAAGQQGTMTSSLQASLAPPALPVASQPSLSDSMLVPPVAPLAAPLPTQHLPPAAQALPAGGQALPSAPAAAGSMQPPPAQTRPRQPTVAELAMQSVLNGGFQWPEVLANVGPSAGMAPSGMLGSMGVCGGGQ